jgi:hypothetical protein
VRPPEREREPVHPARALGQERRDVEAYLQPAVLLVGSEIERQRLAPDDTAHALQLLLAVQVVHLQELRHVGGCDLQRLDRDRAQVDRLDRDGEAGRGRHDHTLAREAHGGLQLLEQHAQLAGLFHAVAEHVAHPRLDPQRLLPPPAAGAVDLEPAAVDHEAQVVAVPDPHQALEVLPRLERVREAQLHVRLRGEHDARLLDPEAVEAGHRDLAGFLLRDADRTPVPAQAERRRLLRALDSGDREGVDAAPRVVHPRKRELPPAVGGFQHLLDPRRVLHVGRDQPARERLALDVGGALRLQPLDRHVE